MTKQEREFRSCLREAYCDILEQECTSSNDNEWTQIVRLQYSKLCDVAEKVFPRINIELCEARWRHEWHNSNDWLLKP